MTDRAAAAKFDLLRQLFDLARGQREAIERGELEQFQQLLDEREVLLTRLSAIIDDAEELPENLIAFPGGAQAASEDALALDTVLKGIIEQDQHNERLLQTQMNEIRQQLPALGVARDAAGAYRLAPARQSFIDRIS